MDVKASIKTIAMKTHQYAYLAMIAASLVACQGGEDSSRSLKDSTRLDEQADSARRDQGNVAPNNATSESAVGDDAAAFMKQAALGGMMEVELGKLAQEKAANAQVKAFAAKMVTDHEKANAELKTLASGAGIILPSEYPVEVKSHMEEMKKLKGAAFDQHYMDMMVNGHVKTLELFKSATTITERPVKEFAGRTLPILESHHKMAQEIQASLK